MLTITFILDSCTGTINGDYLVFESNDTCPVTTSVSGTTINHRGSISWSGGKRGEIVTRRQTVRVGFTCTFETSFMLSTANGVLPLMNNTLIEMDDVDGTVELNLGLRESSEFRTPLAADTVVRVPDNLYVAAVLISSSTWTTVLENCWATPR